MAEKLNRERLYIILAAGVLIGVVAMCALLIWVIL